MKIEIMPENEIDFNKIGSLVKTINEFLEFNDSWYINVWFNQECLNQAYGLRLIKN